MKICFVMTSEFTLKVFMVNQLRRLSSEGAEITVIVNTSKIDLLEELGIQATLIPLHISRRINIFNDIYVLIWLTSFFIFNRFDIVHSITPKAGLLTQIASFITRQPIRLHTFTGQVWANKTGLIRLLLKTADSIYGGLSNTNIVDSQSQRDFLVREGITTKERSVVFERGSISGVDLIQFKPATEIRQQMRIHLKIKDNELVYLFLGRLNTDKGVLDLARAFIQANLLNCKLLFVGPDEGNMQAKFADLPNFDNTNILFIGYTDQPQNFMVAADVLCLPSYREGFGSVIIEAAACGIPTVGSRIYGITDAIEENVTGLMHEVGNIDDLQSKIVQMAHDKVLRERLGKQAYHRAITDFNSELITKAWCDFYRDKLSLTSFPKD